MKILGIDYGKAKIGLAVGETETELAEPLAVWPSSNLPAGRQVFKFQISNLIKEYGIEKIVVGIPGGKIEAEIRRFGEELKKQTGLPVEFFDETLSSQDAQKLLIEIQKKRKFRREMEDAFAAAIMLESYMEVLKNV